MDRLYTYRSELKNPIGHWLYRKNFGGDSIVEHNYLVLQLDGNFISIDKHRENKGCIFIQSGKDLESVAGNFKGSRREKPELITEKSDITGVNHFRRPIPSTFDEMIENLDKELDYHLFTANCITLARTLREKWNKKEKMEK